MPEPFSATAPLKSVKGTSTKPGVTFTGDEDTGLYNSAPDELAISLGGSEKAKFTGTGVNLDGDVTLDDGGTYETTLQMVTPTADRTISFPDATGTVALVAGSNGQLTYNSSGAQAGLTSASIGSADEINISLAGAASTPPVSFTGSWFTGGTSTTTKPQVLIEPSGTTSTDWDTDGTGLGVNAPSGFTGNLLDLQVNGSSKFAFLSSGQITTGGALALQIGGAVGAFFKGTSGTVFRNSLGLSNLNPVSSELFALKFESSGLASFTDGSTGTGYIKQGPVAVSALPSAATVGAGTRGFVNDATATTFASIVAGGGANTVPVYSDGTNWLIG